MAKNDSSQMKDILNHDHKEHNQGVSGSNSEPGKKDLIDLDMDTAHGSNQKRSHKVTEEERGKEREEERKQKRVVLGTSMMSSCCSLSELKRVHGDHIPQSPLTFSKTHNVVVDVRLSLITLVWAYFTGITAHTNVWIAKGSKILLTPFCLSLLGKCFQRYVY